MSDIKKIVETTEKAIEKFNKNIPGIEKKLLNEITLLIKELQLKDGKILSNIENLKLINSLKKKLEKLVLNKEYAKSVADFAKSFTLVSNLQNEYFAQFADKFKPTKTLETVRKMAVTNTIDALTENGITANVTRKLNDMLLKSVTSGSSFLSLTEEMQEYLTQTKNGGGVLSKYAKTYTTDALCQYSAQYSKIVTDDLGLEWFMYIGSNKETTREFCRHLTKKCYIHKSEIPEILKGHIDGHKCELNPKTGLPKGMIEDTTPENFQINRGGYGCGHKLEAVHELAVPQIIRDKFTASAKENNLVKWANESLFKDEIVGKFSAKRYSQDMKIDGQSKKVVVNKNSIKEILSKYRTDPSFNVRIDAIKDIKTILRSAEYLYSEKPKHMKNKTEFHIFEAFLGGVELRIEIKEDTSGLFLYYIAPLK